MTTSRRVGILGGTFDPFHCGHLDVGAAAQTALGLGEVLVLPSCIPPHRPQPLASAYHRFAMVALAIAGRGGWRALDLELREAARSYTSDTLERFRSEGFSASELFFIVGADAFVEIATWKNYPALLDFAHFAVVSRPGVPVAELPARLGSLADRMRLVVGKQVRRSLSEGGSFKRRRKRDTTYERVRLPRDATDDREDSQRRDAPWDSTVIFLIDAVTTNVSSTAIRRARARGESIAGKVPPAVQQHIEQHGLYEDATPVTEAGTGAIGERAGRLHGQN
jgi:nicotinate-nucleotide adenylyltransferase